MVEVQNTNGPDEHLIRRADMNLPLGLLGRALRRRAMEFHRVTWLAIGTYVQHQTPCAVAQLSDGLIPKLSSASSSFDLVTAVLPAQLARMDDQQAFVREVFRVLRPGGLACFCQPNPLFLFAGSTRHRKAVSHWRLRSMVRAAGLRKPEIAFFEHIPGVPESSGLVMDSLLRNLPFSGQYALFCSRPAPRVSERTSQRITIPDGALVFA